MGTLQVQNIRLAFGDRDLLDGVGFTLSEKSRAALAGGNGTGKSTLLKIVAGQTQSDAGSISMTKGMRVSYLPQSDIVLGDRTVLQEVELGYSRFTGMLERQRELETRLSNISETDRHQALLLELHEVQEQLFDSDYYQRSAVMEQILKGLGFVKEDFDRSCGEFSGGWQMRIALARVLAEAPDIMLLDEPTNYLDIEARIWLKNYLKLYHGGVMIVSHDQYFLDETVTEVYELFNGVLTRYAGNYSSYLHQREMEIAALEEAYKRQQAEIERTEQFIERFRYKATKSKQVQSRIKQLEKISPVVVPSHLKKLSFSFPPAPHSGNDVLLVEHLSKSYGDHRIFSDLSFVVRKGERLAVTGRNGAGKSTLLRMLAGTDGDYQGTIRDGAGLKIGYFAQDTEKTLDPKNDVIGEIETIATTADVPRLRNMLGSFLFSDDDVFKQVSVLSGGERSRLALLKILLHPANLLILDEPTNHLDINAKEMLLEALRQYDGTMVFVSHDSYFIEHIATRILYLSEDEPEFFEGDYQYFSWKLEQKEQVSALAGDKDKPLPASACGNGGETPAATQSEPVNSAEARKMSNRRRNKKRSLQQRADQLLADAEALEKQIGDIEERMGLPENYSIAAKITALAKQKEDMQARHELLTEQWFATTSELEEMDQDDEN
ncbi:MAG: ABC-F family ATP-binding cassette domain-containing protein [Sphaerochaetaceae bacterium]|nr:ABC-F family ATP-binding cassette domain-containing protein [Sphaerochaetaceae bacterium]